MAKKILELQNKKITDKSVKNMSVRIRRMINKLNIKSIEHLERNIRKYSIDDAVKIINAINKNEDSVSLINKDILLNDFYSDYQQNEQARLVDTQIAKETETLLKEKKIEYYLAAIAQGIKYKLDVVKLRKDIQYFIGWKIVEQTDDGKTPNKVKEIINRLDNFLAYKE